MDKKSLHSKLEHPLAENDAILKIEDENCDMIKQQCTTKLIPFLVATLLCTSCQQQTKTPDNLPKNKGDQKSWDIITKAIEVHGGEHYQTHDIEFDFRDVHYSSKRDQGIYSYERIFTDSTGQLIRDVLTNEGLVRNIDGKPSEITEERKNAFSNSVNSVIYFALLPYFLNDPAVLSEYIGEATIHNQPYQKVKVHFQEEGGGAEFQDEFVYWFHRDNHTLII
ncbi:MAG: hypothetical protein IPL46_05770 [Saprospiraceae bacterium]|nr:hypothetical protein [Saprospiraceae bacterium]